MNQVHRFVMWCVVGLGLLGYLAALAGFFALGPVLILGLAAGYSLQSLWGRPGGTIGDRWVVPVLVAVGVTVSGLWFSSGLVVPLDVAGAHMSVGRHIAAEGSMIVDAAAGGFASLDGATAAAPGFSDEASSTVDDVRLFTVFVGIGSWFGDGGAFGVSAVLGGLAVFGLIAVAKQWLRTTTALVVGVAFAAGPLYVIASRGAGAGLLGAALATFSVLITIEARRTRNTTHALLAGLALGCAASVTAAAHLVVVGAAVIVATELGSGYHEGWVQRKQRRRFALAISIGMAPPLLLLVWDALLVGRASDVATVLVAGLVVAIIVTAVAEAARVKPMAVIARVPNWVLVTAVLVVMAGLAIFRPPSLGPSDPLVAELQAAEGLPVDGSRTYAEASISWLGWYIGWAALVAGAVGWVLAIRPLCREVGSGWGTLLALGVVPGVAAAILPSAGGIQSQAAMGYLVWTIPALLIGTGWAIDRLWDDPERPVLQLAAIVLAIALIAWPAVQTGFIWDDELQSGAHDTFREICAATDRRTAFVVVDGPARPSSSAPQARPLRSEAAPAIAAALRATCGRPAVAVPALDQLGLTNASAEWEHLQRNVEVVALSRRPDLGATRRIVLSFRTLESTVGRPPSEALTHRLVLYLEG